MNERDRIRDREALDAEVERLKRELENATRKVEENEIQFRCVVESLNEGILITDLDDVVLDCNRRIEELLGYTREEIVGHTAYERLLPAERWEEMRERNLRRRQGVTERYEATLLRKDGTPIRVEVSASPLRNARGEIIGSASVNLDLTERRRAEEALQRSAVLLERNRIAREMHDALAQAFTGVIVQLNAADRILPQSSSEVREHLQRSLALAREGLNEARRSVWSLRPEALERLDLCEALAHLVAQMTTGGSVKAEFEVRGERRDLPPDLSITLYRIAQEALTNIIRHSEAHNARIELEFPPDGVQLHIVDDGKGFEVDRLPEHSGLGLIGMRERAARIGGRLTLASRPGQGAELTIKIPG